MKHGDVLTLRLSENLRQPLYRSDNLIKVTKYSFLLRLTSKKIQLLAVDCAYHIVAVGPDRKCPGNTHFPVIIVQLVVFRALLELGAVSCNLKFWWR